VLIVLPVLAADGKRLIEETEAAFETPSGQAQSSIDILIPAA
jgi:hypothetical protein